MDKLLELAERAEKIVSRVSDVAISSTVCESVEQLEGFHDSLASEVRDLAGLIADSLRARATQGSATDD